MSFRTTTASPSKRGDRLQPMTSVTVAFEYHIRYITDHRILDRNRLQRNRLLLPGRRHRGTGRPRKPLRRPQKLDQTRLPVPCHRVQPHRRKLLPPHLHRQRHGRARNRRVRFAVGSGHDPSGSTVTAPVLLCKAAGSTTYTTYTGDWALYDGYIGETGQTEVEMTVRTNR